MSLKTVTLAHLFALSLASTAMASQSLSGQPVHIDGRSTSAIIAALAEQDIIATNVEEWGGLIRVDTRTESGNQVLFVDKGTLRPTKEANAVGTRLSVGRPATSSVGATASRPASSLVETDD